VGEVLTNVALVLVFVMIGGVFAGAEIALVSLRESQVRQLRYRGRRGATVARLAEDPNRFLSAVQIGVTLMGFLSAAFGGATLSDDLSPVLERWGLSEGVASVLALVIITALISYASILLGELVPKRLALQRAERTSLLLAGLIDRIARLSRPVIWLLGHNADVLVRVLGGDPGAQRDVITEEELRDLVAANEALEPDERRLIEDVFAAGDRQLREVMIPRTEVDFLDHEMPVFRAATWVSTHPHSRYPVVRNNQDDVVGFVHVRDLLDPTVVNRSMRVGELARQVIRLPDTKRVLPSLSEMRRDGAHLAIVVDEYGGTAGIVTLEDLVEELVGDIRDEYDPGIEPARRLVGGIVEVDGLLNIEDFAEETGLVLPEGPYETVAGFVVQRLGHLPQPGETVDVGDSRISVVELDGRRIARLRVAPTPASVDVPPDVPAAASEPSADTPKPPTRAAEAAG
jgi:putative hemolysin